MLNLLRNFILSRAFLQRQIVGGVFAIVSIFLTPEAIANVTGANTQNFVTTASANDYVTVYSSKTLGQGAFSLGLFLNNAVNTLPYFEGQDDEANEDHSTRGKYNDSLFASEVGIGYGVLNQLDLFLGIPAVLYQDVKDKEDRHGEFKQKGITETRVGAKYRIYGTSFFGVAALASVNIPSTKGDPYDGEKVGPTYNTELIGDMNLFNKLDLTSWTWPQTLATAGKTQVKPKVMTHRFLRSKIISFLLPRQVTDLQI
jgi:hypothetical protein